MAQEVYPERTRGGKGGGGGNFRSGAGIYPGFGCVSGLRASCGVRRTYALNWIVGNILVLLLLPLHLFLGVLPSHVFRRSSPECWSEQCFRKILADSCLGNLEGSACLVAERSIAGQFSVSGEGSSKSVFKPLVNPPRRQKAF